MSTYTLTAPIHRNGRETTAYQITGSLKQIVDQLETDQGEDPAIRYEYSREVAPGMHVWYDEQLGVTWDNEDLNGETMIANPDDEDELFHRHPRPLLADLVAVFAANALDVPVKHVSIVGGMMTERLMTTTEAAEYLGVTRSALYQRAHRPEPDVLIGHGPKPVPGWREETLRQWKVRGKENS